MTNRILGKSNLSVSTVAFGCMSLQTDHHQNKALLHEGFHNGINFFDTADLYQQGFNEETVGHAFKGMRDQVVIATKVGNQLRADGNGWDWNPTKEYILQAVEKSLRRLQTDYIDLYQLHGGTIDDPMDETIEAFELLQQRGKIRWYGISSIRPNVIREYVKRSSMVSVMMQYSLLDRRPEEACLELLRQNNIGVLARGTLASGLLIDKPAKSYLNYSEAEVKIASEAVKKISGDTKTPTDTAIQFVLNNPSITSAVVGIRTREQLHRIPAQDATLTPDEMSSLRHTLKANVYEQHR